MKKSVYITILTIVTVICIIAGSCYHIVGWGVSLIDNLIPGFTANESDSYNAGPVIKDEMAITENFDAISVDVNVMSLEIVPGDAANLFYEGNTKIAPKFEVKNGTLYLTQNNMQRSNRFWNLMGKKKKCNVILTVPNDVCYKKIVIDSAVGDIDIAELTADSLVLDTNVGDIALESCEFERVDIDANVGDIAFESCEFERVDIDADVGDVDVTDCAFQMLDVDNSVGDIDVDGVASLPDYTVEMDTDIGTVYVNDNNHRREYSHSGSTDKKITLDNSTGDISVSEK